MKRTVTLLVLIGFSWLLIACASLTEKGKAVKYVTKQEAPKDCKLIDEVEIGGPGSLAAGSVSQLKIKMRNETGEKKGNFLVIDTMEISEGAYSGTGRAYSCP